MLQAILKLKGHERGRWFWTGIAALSAAIGMMAWTHRQPCLGFVSGDMRSCLVRWYGHLSYEGFAGFSTAFTDYTPAYNYLIYLSATLFPQFGAVFGVKIISITFDYLAAALVLWIVERHYRSFLHPMPWLACITVLFWPTVVLNSSKWGQCDVIPTAWLLAFIAAALGRQALLATICFGAAVCFKLQAIFLAPLYFIFLLRGVIPWKQALVLPVVYTVMIFPAWLTGRPLLDLYTIYLKQTDKYPSLSMFSPNFLQWFPHLPMAPTGRVAILGTAALCGLICLYAKVRRIVLDEKTTMNLAALFATLVPFFLPRMHERYFFSADLLSIPFAFTNPHMFAVPLMIEYASYHAYRPFVGMRRVVPLDHLVWFNLGAIVLMLGNLIISTEMGRRRGRRETSS